MTTQPERLHHLLDRARRGVLLPAEAEQLAGLVGELEAALNRVRALADIAPTGAQGPTFAAINLAIQNNLPTT